jgi:isoleucyl-tRNA synthetase
MSKINYKDTLNFPETDFPMKANLPQRFNRCGLFADWQRPSAKSGPTADCP